MDLRDELAIQRTVLANQRTLLSFFTASLAVAVTGVTLIKFFSEYWFYWLGWALLPGAAILLVYGLINFLNHKHMIEKAYKSRLS